MIHSIFKSLAKNKAVQTLVNQKGTIITNNISDEAYLIASAFFSCHQNILVVKSTQYEASQLYQQLDAMGIEDVLFFPVDESQRIEALVQSPELLAECIYTLYHLTLDTPKIIISHSVALVRHLPNIHEFKESIFEISVNDVISIDELKKKLVYLGYQYTSRVDQPFYFGQRGGVVDIYSLQYQHPIRIEFFDDEVESIRFYDVDTLRTFESLKSVTIIPATDILYRDDQIEQAIEKIKTTKDNCIFHLDTFIQDDLNDFIATEVENLRMHDTSFSMYKYLPYLQTTHSIMDYVNGICLVSSYSGVKENYKFYATEILDYNTELFQEGKSLQSLDLHFCLEDLLKSKHIVKGEMFLSKDSDVTFKTRMVPTLYQFDGQMIQELINYQKEYQILIVLKKESHQKQIMNLLEHHQIHYTLISKNDQLNKGINICIVNIEKGIELVDEKIVIITENELYPTATKTKKRLLKYKNAIKISNFDELNIGDYIVHDSHGIGQYLGIKTLEVQGVHRDYLYISYRGNDTLYVPVEQFKMIRKYISKDGYAPKINKLGSAEWQRTKQKIRQKVNDLADYLIDLYAKRMSQKGFACMPDTSLQHDFENEFEYVLTPDQERSIQEIKEDMEKSQPMDRLLCGDVGFGKTEVALRAAFKAIVNGKQVAILCPTTILSSQHYQTVEKRFQNFPISVALLNRFTTSKRVKEIEEGLKNGTIDMVIGTHKILANSIQFKDIGLLIVDEEQRFGVYHKEKIKLYKETIDVLTLSATPIPRTLQMSLMGIRGFSQIQTPPINRLPVQTYVMEKNQTLIKQVIERELGRNGQVFYLYNKTSNIESVATTISKMIPGAKVGVGHGRMSSEELEDVMTKFLEKEYNVLVCTTIIETGIDIPNANTLIVEDADKFGLSQLYQIKGRVGRSDRNAYAYLLYQGGKSLNETATKRLKAIKEFTQLGSGYKIAMRDLTIRGAGDILGGEQAGFIDTVGFDMYMKILQEVINEKQGIVEKEDIPVLNVNVDGYIPSNYVNTDFEKIELYQRLNDVESLENLKELKEELKDLYGSLPSSVETLVIKREFDLLMNQSCIEGMKEDKNFVEISLTEEFSNQIDGEKLFIFVMEYHKFVIITYTRKQIVIRFKKDKEWLSRANIILSKLKEL